MKKQKGLFTHYNMGKATQQYLKEKGENLPPLNENEKEISQIFSGAIIYASEVFAYHLIMGGTYNNTKRYKEVLELLKELNKIIENPEDNENN